MMLIKPTWGNIRIGMSFMVALKRYKMVISMPSYTSLERKVNHKGVWHKFDIECPYQRMGGTVKKEYKLILYR